MSYQGVVKSIGRDFGFIECPGIYATYQRDVFLNKALIGEAQYLNLSVGEQLAFDVTEDHKGQPQAVNIQQSGKAGAVSKGKGKSRRLLPQKLIFVNSPTRLLFWNFGLSRRRCAW